MYQFSYKPTILASTLRSLPVYTSSYTSKKFQVLHGLQYQCISNWIMTTDTGYPALATYGGATHAAKSEMRDICSLAPRPQGGSLAESS